MPQTRDAKALQWVDLTDFTPGIYQRSERVLANNAIPAPLGAAQVTNTYRCQALPTGGLAPLPGRTKSWNIPAPAATFTNGCYVNGFYAFGPLNPATVYTDEVFVGLEYIDAATTRRRWRVYQCQLFNNPASPNGMLAANLATVVVLDSTVANPTNTKYWGSSFASTRINSTDATHPGTPVVVFDWSGDLTPAQDYILTYPDPATPTSTATSLLGNRSAQVVAHQGRVVILEGAGYAHGPAQNSATNEQVSFTDPPNSPTLGTQQEIFSQENPVGYGAWGSISAGELFLVKQQGGGVIVSGDVANPSVTRLPGVISTGGLICRAASTPQGLFYTANRVGVCVWRGGDTSQVVSEQLDGDFFRTSFSNLYTEGIFLNGVSVSVESWGPWVAVSNNWLYNTITRAWWRLEDPSVVTLQWFSHSFDPRFMWGATPTFTSTAVPVVHVFDQTVPATNYSWQSHPIPASIDRLVEVRDMVLVAQGSGTVTVTLTAFDGSTQAEVFTVTNASQPQRLRPAQGGTFIKGYNVVVRIQSDGVDTAAPVVHALHLGCREAQQVSAS